MNKASIKDDLRKLSEINERVNPQSWIEAAMTLQVDLARRVMG